MLLRASLAASCALYLGLKDVPGREGACQCDAAKGFGHSESDQYCTFACKPGFVWIPSAAGCHPMCSVTFLFRNQCIYENQCPSDLLYTGSQNCREKGCGVGERLSGGRCVCDAENGYGASELGCVRCSDQGMFVGFSGSCVTTCGGVPWTVSGQCGCLLGQEAAWDETVVPRRFGCFSCAYFDMETWECAGQCPLYRYFGKLRGCVADCSLTVEDLENPAGRWCVDNCSVVPRFGYVNGATCEKYCPEGTYLRRVDGKEPRCLKRCPENTKLYTYGARYEFEDEPAVPYEVRECLDECPPGYLLHKNYECVEFCPAGYHKYFGICSTACVPGWFSYNGDCLLSCPPNTLRHKAQCLTACPSGYTPNSKKDTCITVASKSGKVVGIVLGVLIPLCIIVAVSIYCCWKKKHWRETTVTVEQARRELKMV